MTFEWLSGRESDVYEELTTTVSRERLCRTNRQRRAVHNSIVDYRLRILKLGSIANRGLKVKTALKDRHYVMKRMPRNITVDGMSCGGCERTVEEALVEVDGVESASADHGSGTVTVDGDADESELIQAIEDAGYTAHS